MHRWRLGQKQYRRSSLRAPHGASSGLEPRLRTGLANVEMADHDGRTRCLYKVERMLPKLVAIRYGRSRNQNE